MGGGADFTHWGKQHPICSLQHAGSMTSLQRFHGEETGIVELIGFAAGGTESTAGKADSVQGSFSSSFPGSS